MSEKFWLTLRTLHEFNLKSTIKIDTIHYGGDIYNLANYFDDS